MAMQEVFGLDFTIEYKTADIGEWQELFGPKPARMAVSVGGIAKHGDLPLGIVTGIGEDGAITVETSGTLRHDSAGWNDFTPTTTSAGALDPDDFSSNPDRWYCRYCGSANHPDALYCGEIVDGRGVRRCGAPRPEDGWELAKEGEGLPEELAAINEIPRDMSVEVGFYNSAVRSVFGSPTGRILDNLGTTIEL
jgi:hypothetical protein